MKFENPAIPFTNHAVDITEYLGTKDLTQFSFQQLRIAEIDCVENGIEKTYSDIVTMFEPFQIKALFSDVEIPGKYFLRVTIKLQSLLPEVETIHPNVFVGEIDIMSGMMNLRKFKPSKNDPDICFKGYRLKAMMEKPL